jgi:hypothetical protein
MATDFDWQGFRALTRRLDDLVSGERFDAEFADDLRRALSFVYTAGITMPSAGDIYEDAGGDAFWGAKDGPGLASEADTADGIVLAEALADRIAESIEAAQPDDIGDPEEIVDVATTAAENVLAVTSALAEGSALYDEGRSTEAWWEWSFQFDDWGSHALSSLSALHELLWGAR